MTEVLYPVQDLIPHSDDMVLLDKIESYTEHRLQASLTITADSLFAEDEGIPAWMGLEYMGQAIAAMAGITARNRGEPVRVGFLVSTRRYEPEVSHFSCGSQLTITVEVVTFNTTGLRVFECSIYDKAYCLVKANLNVYMPENIEEFMKESSK